MVQTRSQTGTALKKPKRFIEEVPISKPVTKKTATKKTITKKAGTTKPVTKKIAVKKTATKKPATKKRAIKKSAVKESPTKESAIKKSITIIKYCATTKRSAAAIKTALEDAIGSEEERPTGRAPAALIYPVTDKNGNRRIKHLRYPMEEIEKFDKEELDEFLQKEMREHDS